MTIFTYRKENDPDLINAATKAYGQAPPEHTGTGRFARSLNRAPAAPDGEDTSLAATVRRNNLRLA